jgi:hypothetical protein
VSEHLTEDQAQAMLEQLTRHYNERVARASDHCSALLEWVRIIEASGYAPEVEKAWTRIHITLLKSNLAARLVYGGERPRTIPCPIHKGHWSGCVWGDNACPEGCMWGDNVTGWLCDPHPFQEGPVDGDFRTRRWCQQCGGKPDAAIHAIGKDTPA